MLRRQAIAAFRPRPVLETRLRGPSGAPRPRARPNSPRERPLPSANMTLLPAPWALARSHPRTMARTPVAWPMALPPSLILHSFTSTVNAHRWCTFFVHALTTTQRCDACFPTLFFLSLPLSLFSSRYFNPPHRSRRVSMHPPSPPSRHVARSSILLCSQLSFFRSVQRIWETIKNSNDLLRPGILVDTPRSSLPTLYFASIDLEQQSYIWYSRARDSWNIIKTDWQFSNPVDYVLALEN